MYPKFLVSCVPALLIGVCGWIRGMPEPLLNSFVNCLHLTTSSRARFEEQTLTLQKKTSQTAMALVGSIQCDGKGGYVRPVARPPGT